VTQHPHQLHAQAALWSLRAALRHLAAHEEAALIRRPQLGPPTSRPRSLASLQRHDALLREERAERAAGSLNGLKPSAGSTGPISPGLVDLRAEINQTLVEAHGLLAYVHHRDPLLAWSAHWHTVLADAFHIEQDARWTWLSVVLPATRPKLAEPVRLLLEDADARVRSICGLDPDHLEPPLAPACPACDRRRLRIQHSAPDTTRWTVVCTDSCRCIGTACPCDMDVKARGVRHIWAANSALAASIRTGVEILAQAVAA
jgi:hypothetical protein